MNIINIFQYLYDTKGKPLPLEFKIIYNLLTEDELIINGDLDLYKSNITSLPDNLTVNGKLRLTGCKITKLPKNLTVNGKLNINHTKVATLPKNLKVKGKLKCINTPLAKKLEKNDSLLDDYERQFNVKIVFYEKFNYKKFMSEIESDYMILH